MIKRPCCPVTNSMTAEDRLQVQSRELHQLQLIVDYVSNVMSPLMNPSFVTPPLLVDVAGNAMSEVGKTIESMRPARRKNKEVNPVSRSALALPDLCFLPSSHPTKPLPPTISIEIKPKRGFIPTSPHIAKEHQIKLEVCKYCLHSSLKVDRGMWTHASRYCPIDLFSGNVNRMKHALSCLMETPRNNFRICKNGLEICGELTFEDLSEQLQGFLSRESFVEQNGVSEKRYLSDFMDLIIGALMWVPPADRQKSHRISEEVPPVQRCANSSYSPSHSHNSGDKAGLPPGCILDSILRLQRLDDLDIERIILLYKQLKQHIKEHPEDSEKWELDGPYSDGSWKLHQNASSPKSIVQKIKEFLMSMTVQDCSIMISLQPVDGSEADNRYAANNPDHTLMDVHGQMYKFAVGTIDLDPKPFDKIPKYFHLDLDIVEAYKKAHVIVRDSHSDKS